MTVSGRGERYIAAVIALRQSVIGYHTVIVKIYIAMTVYYRNRHGMPGAEIRCPAFACGLVGIKHMIAVKKHLFGIYGSVSHIKPCHSAESYKPSARAEVIFGIKYHTAVFEISLALVGKRIFALFCTEKEHQALIGFLILVSNDKIRQTLVIGKHSHALRVASVFKQLRAVKRAVGGCPHIVKIPLGHISARIAGKLFKIIACKAAAVKFHRIKIGCILVALLSRTAGSRYRGGYILTYGKSAEAIAV